MNPSISSNFVKCYTDVCGLNNGNYQDKFVLTGGEDYTHAIILNTAMPNLKIPKKNVIGLALEPSYSRFLNITDINMITGLGTAFISKNWITKIWFS